MYMYIVIVLILVHVHVHVCSEASDKGVKGPCKKGTTFLQRTPSMYIICAVIADVIIFLLE